MQLKSSALGISAAIIAALAFGICGLFFALLPGPTAAFLSWVLHVDITGMTVRLSAGNLILGIGFFAAYVGLLVGLTASVYNRLTLNTAK